MGRDGLLGWLRGDDYLERLARLNARMPAMSDADRAALLSAQERAAGSLLLLAAAVLLPSRLAMRRKNSSAYALLLLPLLGVSAFGVWRGVCEPRLRARTAFLLERYEPRAQP